MEKKIRKIVLADYSAYKEDLCNTGGCYGFKITYEKDGEYFRRYYYTTAEFSYCRVGGRFSDCPCSKVKECTGYELISPIDVLNDVVEWWDKHLGVKGCYMELEYEPAE